jgi:hypothetical protein
MRAERRRQARERRAARPEGDGGERGDAGREEWVEHLDEGIARLGGVDRELVVLRYLQERPFGEVATELGLSEAAARKRAGRAIEKLRGYLAGRGVVLSAEGLAAVMAAEAGKGVPTGVAQTVLTPSPGAKALAKGVTNVRGAVVKVAVAGAIVGVSYSLWWTSRPAPPTVVRETPADLRPVVVGDPGLAGYPIAKGWPVALPGTVIGTPVVVDLEGNGTLCVVVPVTDRYPEVNLVHPRRNTTGYLYALRADGTLLPGWPARLAGATPPQPGNGGGSGWSASPTVFRDGDRDGVLMQIRGAQRAYVVHADGSTKAVGGGNATVSIPVVDLDGDGVMDYVTGKVIANVRGGTVGEWPMSRRFKNGYVPCVGDADGDGRPELYHLFYTERETGAVKVGGFDRTGAPLPGWPRIAEDASWFPPAMGDIDGDGKKEVVAAYGQRIYAWTWSGKDLPCDIEDGGHNGVFKKDVVACTATPTLADLDGDGNAEVIVYDQRHGCIRAWHGDGKPVVPHPFLDLVPGTDGVIARVPGRCHGVSVADLGGDGVIDLFTGTSWVKFDPKSGKAEVTAMVPGEPMEEWVQPTVCDLDGDGKGDVVFGLTDGRVVVYSTGLAYRAEWVQWGTAQGNVRHTSCWEGPGRR